MLKFYFKVRKRVTSVRKRTRKKNSIKSQKDYIEHKEMARVLVLERLEYFNQFYNLKWGRVSIKNVKTRWGSCSSKGNLNFSYKIIKLAPHLADYIIVHELCHLKEMNHAQAFWDLVAQQMPEYKALKNELAKIKLYN